jgi:outer membrane protein TolC
MIERRGIVLIAFAVAGALCFAGCLGPAKVYREVAESRAEAYDNWLSQRQAEKAEQVRLQGKLSLQDALKLSMVNNKTLLAAFEDKGVAKGRMVEAIGETLPSADANLGYTRLDRVSSFNVAGQAVSLGALNNYSADLTVTQPLFRGGAISAGVRAARVYTALTDESVRSVAQDVILAVATAYYDVLLAQELVEVQKAGVEASKSALNEVERKKVAGVAKPYDVLRAQVELSNFEAAEIKERNQVNRAKTVLLLLMGVSQESDITLADEMTYIQMKPVFEEAVRVAFENRPDIYQAELQMRLQREALRVAYSYYFPSADASFTETWSRPDPHDSMIRQWGNKWSGGISVNWTLFDGFKREGRIMQEAATLRKNRIQIIDAEEHALQQVEASVLSVQDADEFVQSQRLNLDRAQEALRLARVGKDAGVGTQVEVYDAQAAATQAMANYYEALYGHTIARLALQRAMGILGPRPGEKAGPDKTPVPAWIEEFMKTDKTESQPEPKTNTQPETNSDEGQKP